MKMWVERHPTRRNLHGCHYYLKMLFEKMLIIPCNFYMPCKSYTILRILDATFGVLSWPQLNWCNMYVTGHFFVNKFLEEVFTVIVIFCVWTSHPWNNLSFFFYQIQPLYSYKVCPCKKVYNILGNLNGTALTKLVRSTSMKL